MHKLTESRAPHHPSPADVADIGLLRLMQSSRELIDLAQIARICGVHARQAPARWRRASENYTDRGWHEWPPTLEVQRNFVTGEAPDGERVDELPPHPNVLPRPAIPGDGVRGGARWYAGDIYRWAMRTYRISMIDCVPIVGAARRAQGAVRDRGLLRSRSSE